MTVEIQTIAIRQYQFSVRVIADGRCVHEEIATPGTVIRARNRQADYWSSCPDVVSVTAARIPWHPELVR